MEEKHLPQRKRLLPGSFKKVERLFWSFSTIALQTTPMCLSTCLCMFLSACLDFRSRDPEMGVKDQSLKYRISALTIEAMDLKLHTIILDASLHNFSISDFSISGHVI